MEKADIPAEWLKKLAEKYLTEEEKKQIEAMGWDKLMETLRERLKEQKGRHQGGNKWIGTAGTSPFGAHGYNPEGIRIGQDSNRNNRAVKVWDKREFKDLDGNVDLGIRNIKVALRRLRKFARTGAPDELDLDTTIRETANHGYLDVHMRPERRNAVKVLMFFDVGGSMDMHIAQVEELFSARAAEFKHMEYFYFHNCLYESVWTDKRRRATERTPTWDILHKYPHDYKIVFVGDASMSPYEIAIPRGSVEHDNEEAGRVWMERVPRTYPHAVWLNPVEQRYWYAESIGMVRKMMGNRMFPLTLDGLEAAMRGTDPVKSGFLQSFPLLFGSGPTTRPPLPAGWTGARSCRLEDRRNPCAADSSAACVLEKIWQGRWLGQQCCPKSRQNRPNKRSFAGSEAKRDRERETADCADHPAVRKIGLPEDFLFNDRVGVSGTRRDDGRSKRGERRMQTRDSVGKLIDPGLPAAQAFTTRRWRRIPAASASSPTSRAASRTRSSPTRSASSCNLEHRGAVGADPRAGDGAGILVQIPHAFFARKAAELGFKLPEPGAIRRRRAVHAARCGVAQRSSRASTPSR